MWGNKYRRLWYKFYHFHHKYIVIRKKSELKILQEFMNDPLLKHVDQALSLDSKWIFYNIHALYCGMTNDLAGQYNLRKKIVDQGEHNGIETSDTHLTALLNLASSQADLKKYDDFFHTIAKLRSIPLKSKSSKAEVFQDTYLFTLQLHVYIKTGKIEKGIALIDEIKNVSLEKIRSTTNPDIHFTLFYLIPYLYFILGKYDQSLGWLNKLLNETDLEVRQDIHCFARILNLITHFELENLDLLKYQVKSTYRFLYKRKRLYKFETIILNFIRKKLPKINISVKKELIDVFEKLRKEVIEISKEPFEQKALEYFDFISWLESKIENRPFMEVLKEKAAAK